MPGNVLLTLGLSFDDYKSGKNQDVEAVNPKLGLRWSVTPSIQLRFAAFQSVKRALLANRTIEPTQVAGFNQYFDDINGARSRQYGIGLDVRAATWLYVGSEIMRRHISLVDTGESRQDNISREGLSLSLRAREMW